ncbi:hypothetical protein E5Q_04608 [Mixia osmundae IAM 14324]|uniref:GATA-type domain-containing protein n=2 Tax=Mixia osmundae (strain CBS 9802 / IAM 14324 / JCM 22182 / KY 12970) TaxID=764103 RepID=G7E518_MIXOS|nr:hypothetical protein E5Q_04608 [Mixia osmundae IAM 14324]
MSVPLASAYATPETCYLPAFASPLHETATATSTGALLSPRQPSGSAKGKAKDLIDYAQLERSLRLATLDDDAEVAPEFLEVGSTTARPSEWLQSVILAAQAASEKSIPVASRAATPASTATTSSSADYGASPAQKLPSYLRPSASVVSTTSSSSQDSQAASNVLSPLSLLGAPLFPDQPPAKPAITSGSDTNDQIASKMWRYFTRAKDDVPQGSRLENLSWRMMHMQLGKDKRASATPVNRRAASASKIVKSSQLVMSPLPVHSRSPSAGHSPRPLVDEEELRGRRGRSAGTGSSPRSRLPSPRAHDYAATEPSPLGEEAADNVGAMMDWRAPSLSRSRSRAGNANLNNRRDVSMQRLPEHSPVGTRGIDDIMEWRAKSRSRSRSTMRAYESPQLRAYDIQTSIRHAQDQYSPDFLTAAGQIPLPPVIDQPETDLHRILNAAMAMPDNITLPSVGDETPLSTLVRSDDDRLATQAPDTLSQPLSADFATPSSSDPTLSMPYSEHLSHSTPQLLSLPKPRRKYEASPSRKSGSIPGLADEASLKENFDAEYGFLPRLVRKTSFDETYTASLAHLAARQGHPDLLTQGREATAPVESPTSLRARHNRGQTVDSSRMTSVMPASHGWTHAPDVHRQQARLNTYSLPPTPVREMSGFISEVPFIQHHQPSAFGPSSNQWRYPGTPGTDIYGLPDATQMGPSSGLHAQLPASNLGSYQAPVYATSMFSSLSMPSMPLYGSFSAVQAGEQSGGPVSPNHFHPLLGMNAPNVEQHLDLPHDQQRSLMSPAVIEEDDLLAIAGSTHVDPSVIHRDHIAGIRMNDRSRPRSMTQPSMAQNSDTSYFSGSNNDTTSPWLQSPASSLADSITSGDSTSFAHRTTRLDSPKMTSTESDIGLAVRAQAARAAAQDSRNAPRKLGASLTKPKEVDVRGPRTAEAVKKAVTPAIDDKSTVCMNCKTSNTPLWRRDELGQPLCNSCGLFKKLHGVNRPLALATGVIKKRNRRSTKDLVVNGKKAIQSAQSLSSLKASRRQSTMPYPLSGVSPGSTAASHRRAV